MFFYQRDKNQVSVSVLFYLKNQKDCVQIRAILPPTMVSMAELQGDLVASTLC